LKKSQWFYITIEEQRVTIEVVRALFLHVY